MQAVQGKAARWGLFLSGGSDFHGLYSEKPVSIGDRVCEIYEMR
jgi:hypothetical protein